MKRFEKQNLHSKLFETNEKKYLEEFSNTRKLFKKKVENDFFYEKKNKSSNLTFDYEKSKKNIKETLKNFSTLSSMENIKENYSKRKKNESNKQYFNDLDIKLRKYKTNSHDFSKTNSFESNYFERNRKKKSFLENENQISRFYEF